MPNDKAENPAAKLLLAHLLERDLPCFCSFQVCVCVCEREKQIQQHISDLHADVPTFTFTRLEHCV